MTEAEKILKCAKSSPTRARTTSRLPQAFHGRRGRGEDIRLFAAHIGKDVKMKAAGRIRSLKDAEDFLALGCRRLGTSAPLVDRLEIYI